MPMTAAGGSKAAESGDHDLLARAIDKISSLELELNQGRLFDSFFAIFYYKQVLH